MSLAIIFHVAAFSTLALAQHQIPTTCDTPFINNQSDIAIVSNCTVIGEQSIGLQINASIAGPIEIPNVQSIKGSIEVVGGIYKSDFPNITSFSMPDVKNITGLTIINVDKLTALSLPKLDLISGPLMFNSQDGPPLNFSLPALETAGGPMYILGNIDAIQFPNLRNTGAVNVNSTGDLDCSSLSRALSVSTITILHDSLICYGSKGNATIGSYVDVTPTGDVPTTSSTSSTTVAPTSTISTTTSPAGSQKTNIASVRKVSLFLTFSISAVVIFASV